MIYRVTAVNTLLHRDNIILYEGKDKFMAMSILGNNTSIMSSKGKDNNFFIRYEEIVKIIKKEEDDEEPKFKYSLYYKYACKCFDKESCMCNKKIA